MHATEELLHRIMRSRQQPATVIGEVVCRDRGAPHNPVIGVIVMFGSFPPRADTAVLFLYQEDAVETVMQSIKKVLKIERTGPLMNCPITIQFMNSQSDLDELATSVEQKTGPGSTPRTYTVAFLELQQPTPNYAGNPNIQ